mmetsp:Transcript_7261/g.13451  ORF Transcript_7261/g.13451 Transcript_7261/m.13451 type:complete len:578 (+) Transcript_7261:2339-4072(+)
MIQLVNAKLSFNTGTVTVISVMQEEEHWTTFRAEEGGQGYVLKVFKLEMPLPRCYFQRELKALRLIGEQEGVIRLRDFKISEDKLGFLLYEGWEESVLSGMKKQLSEETVQKILASLVSPLTALTHHALVYRNLLPASVVINSKGQFCLADFSLCVAVAEWNAMSELEKREDLHFSGNRHFRAPEEFQGSIGPLADVWRLGCLVYVLLNHELPFSSHEDIMMGRLRLPRRKLSVKWHEFFSRALCPDTMTRARISDLMEIVERPLDNSKAVTPGLTVQPSNSAKLLSYFKKSTNSWIETATSNTDTPPDPVYVQKLLLKAHNKPFKIPKFYAKLMKLPISKTPVAIKSLMLMHRYLFLGPEWVYNQSAGADQFLNYIEESWQSAVKVKRDAFFNDYFCGLVRNYSRLLREKLTIHRNTHLDGKWHKASISDPRVLTVIMNYWHKATHIASALFIGETQLPQLRAALVLQLLEEIIRLVQFLTHIFFELAPKAPQFFPEMLTKFQQNYQKTLTLAKTVKKDRPFVQMPVLPEDLHDRIASLVDRECEFSPQAILYATESLKSTSRFSSMSEGAKTTRK